MNERKVTGDCGILKSGLMMKHRKPRKRHTRVDRDGVEQLLKKGMNSAEIARTLNISLSSVTRIKRPNYAELYMTELRKHVRIAVRRFFKEQKRKGFKLHEVEERTRLKGKDENQLLSILENVGGDRQLGQELRELKQIALEADLDVWYAKQRAEYESLTDEEKHKIKEDKKNWVEEAQRQLDWLDPKRKKLKDFATLKV